jgi:succinyl-diaminopimelate desuccinylase
MDTGAFLAAACELLAIPSTSDRPAELQRALDFVLAFASAPALKPGLAPGLTAERFESGGKPSALLYYGSPRPPRFRVVLNAHLDVVPAAADQFRPRRDGDRLYARGAQDMKVTGLVQAQVFRELAAALPYPLALQLVTDEEVGGRAGCWPSTRCRPRRPGVPRSARRRPGRRHASSGRLPWPSSITISPTRPAP